MEDINQFNNIKLRNKMQIMTTEENSINTYKFAKILDRVVPTSMENKFIALFDAIKDYLCNNSLDNKKSINEALINVRYNETDEKFKNPKNVLSSVENLNIDINTKIMLKKFLLTYYKFMINLYSQIYNVGFNLECIENYKEENLSNDLSIISLNIKLLEECLSKLIPISLIDYKYRINSDTETLEYAIYLMELSGKLYNRLLNEKQLCLETSELAKIPNNKVSDSIISGFYNQISSAIKSTKVAKSKKLI